MVLLASLSSTPTSVVPSSQGIVMNSKYAQILIVLVFVVTFFIDTVSPMGYEVWVGHIFAVLLALWIERPNAPYVVAGIATILLILEFWLSPPGIPPDMAVFNRTVGGLYSGLRRGLSLGRKQPSLTMRPGDWGLSWRAAVMPS